MSPSPTATPTPTSDAGVVAFGGSCANALSLEEASALMGQPVIASYATRVGGGTPTGAISCAWDTTASALGEIVIKVYPADVVPSSEKDAACSPKAESCELRATVGDAWVIVSGSVEGKDSSVLQEAVLDAIRPHLLAYPAPAAGQRTAQWWTVPSCAQILPAIDLTPTGFTALTLKEQIDSWYPFAPEGDTRVCSVTASGGPTGDLGILVSIEAGGAGDRSAPPDVIATVSVPGAAAAVLAHTPGPYEPGPDHLDATDGVNLLQIIPDRNVDPATLTRIAGPILADLAKTVH